MNSTRFSGKLTHTGAFSPLSPEGRLTGHTGINRTGVSGPKPKCCSPTETFSHEQPGREPKCSRWETLENRGWTVLVPRGIIIHRHLTEKTPAQVPLDRKSAFGLSSI